MMRSKRVVVAMSGGVDSSLASFLLKEAGYEVIGVTMKLISTSCHEQHSKRISCCRLEDSEDARRIAQRLDIPFYVLNLEKEFEQEVIRYFIREYAEGRTPSPCIVCNDAIKFGMLLKKAKALHAEYIATGHYARVQYDEVSSRYLLKKGIDVRKDQSYFLSRLSQEKLRHTLFPLGSFTKEKTREIGKEIGFTIHNKPESQEICFIPDGNYHQLLKERVAEEIKPGFIVDNRGKILGEHKSTLFFTIGQRKGLGIAQGYPLYVTAIDKEKNIITVGTKEETFQDQFVASKINWITTETPRFPLTVMAKIRHKHKETEVVVYPLPNERVSVRFKKPQPAITPGQAVVFYDNDIVIGGGWIDKVQNHPFDQ